jgi:hypothetical protein
MPNEHLPDDIRDVWQSQPVENTTMPLDEIRRSARRFEKRIQHRNLREYAGGAAGLAAFTYYLFKFDSLSIRAGSALIIAGMLSIMVQIYKRASPGKLPPDMALTESLQFHRRELERQRDLLRSVWRWYIGPVLPGLLVFTAGTIPHHGSGRVFFVLVLFYAVVFGWIIWLNHRAAQRLDRQIAEIRQIQMES